MKITRRELRRIIMEQRLPQDDLTNQDVVFADPKIIKVIHLDEEEGLSRLVAIFTMSDGKNQAFYRSTGKSMGWGGGKWFPIDGWATGAAQADPVSGGSPEDSMDAWWVKTFKEKTVPPGTPQFDTLQSINRSEKENAPFLENETIVIPDPSVDPAGAHKALSGLNMWLRDANAIKTTHVNAPAYKESEGEVVMGRRPFFGLHEGNPRFEFLSDQDQHDMRVVQIRNIIDEMIRRGHTIDEIVLALEAVKVSLLPGDETESLSEAMMGQRFGVEYTALVLDDESQRKLAELSPDGWKIHSHHMTIISPPNQGDTTGFESEWMGGPYCVDIVAVAQGSMVMTGLVDLGTLVDNRSSDSPGSLQLPFKGPTYPHVTIATNPAEGGKPAMSNWKFKPEIGDGLDQFKLLSPPITVCGNIEEIMR